MKHSGDADAQQILTKLVDEDEDHYYHLLDETIVDGLESLL